MDRHGIISIAMQISLSGCWLRLNFLPFPLLHIFCHIFSFSAATFSRFFLHSRCLGLIVMPGRRGRPRTPYQRPSCPTGAAASSAVVSAAVSKSRDDECRCPKHRCFIICTCGPSSASSPSVPLEELHDLMVLISGQLSAHQSSNPLQLLHLGLFCRVLRLSFSFVG